MHCKTTVVKSKATKFCINFLFTHNFIELIFKHSLFVATFATSIILGGCKVETQETIQPTTPVTQVRKAKNTGGTQAEKVAYA